MINLDDILDMSDLSREVVDALAEHEHTGTMNAALLGEYLMHQHHGAAHVHSLIADDLRQALHAHNLPHARELWAVLQHYVTEHPEAVRGSDPK